MKDNGHSLEERRGRRRRIRIKTTATGTNNRSSSSNSNSHTSRLLWLFCIVTTISYVSAAAGSSRGSSRENEIDKGPVVDRIGASLSTPATSDDDDGGTSWANSTEPQPPQGQKEDGQCVDGLLIPMWEPHENLSTGDRVARGLVYFLAMIYLFIGVSIIADRFMGAIEVITSKEKEIRVKKPNGDVQIVVVRVWNETVANLSLMALGSSAPEILLSIIEVYAKDYDAGDLGPGTIVGSAAFNLFMIIGLCVYVIPDGQVRKIKHLRVFFVTATWSIFAYVWLYLILAVFSEGVVEIWEGVVTFLFFPATVMTAYIADRRLLFYKYISKQYRVNRRGVIVETEGGGGGSGNGNDIEMSAATGAAGGYGKRDGLEGMDGNHVNQMGLKKFEEEEMNDDVREFEEHRREYIQLLRELRKKHPDLDMRAIEALAREELASSGPKSRAFYRIQATRKLTGGANLVKKAMDRTASDLAQVVTMPAAPSNQHGLGDNVIRIFFDPGHYTVMENVGEFAASVRREGGDPNQTVLVDYRTEDGSANAGSDYIAVQGTLIFQPRETLKTFNVCVIDDDVFEEDEHFYIRLSNARLLGGSGGTFGSKVDLIATSNQNGEAVSTVADRQSNSNLGANGGSDQVRSRSNSALVPLVSAAGGSGGGGAPEVSLIAPFLATVMILDDDHCGIFNLAEKDIELVESVGTYDFRVVRWSGARGRVAVPFRTIEGTAKEGKDYEAIEGEVIFENNEIEKIVSLHILEEDSYEKDVLFYLEIDQPRQLGDDEPVGQDNLGSTANNRQPNSLSFDEKVALLGRPKLGEITRSQIRIKESKEFKNTVDKLVQRANASLVVGSSSWKEQFIEAITVNPSDDDDDNEDGGDEDREEKMPSCTDYILHFLTLFWKILFAFVPPTDIWDGYVAFVVSILLIGALTAVIGDLSSHLGCTVGLKDTVTAIAFVALGTSIPDRMGGWLCFTISIIWIGVLTAVIGDVASAFGCSVGLKDSVTAIAFVALGTSVPDTFASKVAAVQDKYADASVGNVTGSNAVNVFLGIGIAWSMAAIVKAYRGEVFRVPVGSLAFSVTLFCTTAALAMMVMMMRRSKLIGGELGGPRSYKIATSCLFVALWLFYVLMSSLEAYGYIQGF